MAVLAVAIASCLEIIENATTSNQQEEIDKAELKAKLEEKLLLPPDPLGGPPPQA